jgi:hypothetical protein
MSRKKLLLITPHWSTGGAPQVTLNKVELLKDHYDIMVVEYAFIAAAYVVQRNKVIDILGKNFVSLGENKLELLDIIDLFNPDVVSLEEFPEMFMDHSLTGMVYDSDRTYRIIETTHDSSFNPKHKLWMPDEFVFVSAYNVFKYSHLEIPMRVIEYPVNLQLYLRDNKVKPHLDVCIVGLWTQRKNQGYAIELAKKLVEYNVRFHFIGNQAGNFQDYWEPLMKDLPGNCIVHGEMNDVPNFVKNCDMFLFTSKGDRNNKELNPIAIKEAMNYPHIPKMLFNLDVYCNKYNDYEDVSYLSGQVESDVQLIKDKLQLKEYRKELVVIGTYPNTAARTAMTYECIISHKKLNRDILLVSHYHVPISIQHMVDYYLYDRHNPMIEHSYYNRFTKRSDNYSVEMRIEGDVNQSLCVLTNLMNAYKFAKSNGYTHLYYNTFDVSLHEDDIETVEAGFRMLGDDWKAYLATLDTPFGRGIQTNGMIFDVNIMHKFIDDVRYRDEYNLACQSIGSQNFLEDYLMKRAERTTGLWLEHPYEGTFLKNSGLGKSSNSEYFGIVEDKEGNKYFYLYTYNVDDDRVISIEIEADSDKSTDYYLEDSKEVLYAIPEGVINLYVTFIDEQDENVHHFDVTQPQGTITVHKKIENRPKIKLVHIQTTLNDEREKSSRRSLEQVTDYGWEYIIHTNHPYKDMPPRHNCVRPDSVSMELFDSETATRLGTALTPAHYGCYEAFKNAILSEFNDCDYLIVCEGDCLIEGDVASFIHKVEKCALMLDKSDIKIMSFGDKDTLEQGWPQSPVVEEVNNDMYITNHIIGLQCIMFPASVSIYLKEQLRIHKWDAADLYFNIIFEGTNMGIVYDRLTTQADGYSLIDKQYKTFKK